MSSTTTAPSPTHRLQPTFLAIGRKDLSQVESAARDTSSAMQQLEEKAQTKITPIISGVVNKCMREMGYFPGIRQILEESRREIAGLREQNSKLIADNTTLTRVTTQQGNQIQSLLTNREQELGALQAEVIHLRNERETQARVQQQYSAESFFLHQELERITAGAWHQQMRLVPPSRTAAKRTVSVKMNTQPPAQPSPAAQPPHANAQLTGKRPALTMAATNQNSTAPPAHSGSTHNSPTSNLNVQQNYHAIPSGHAGTAYTGPSTQSPISLPSYAAPPPRRSSASHALPPGTITSPMKSVPPHRPQTSNVIDLTEYGDDLNGPRKKRKFDESSPRSSGGPATSSDAVSLDMQTMDQEIASMQRELNDAMDVSGFNAQQSEPPDPAVSVPEEAAEDEIDENSDIEDDIWDDEGFVRMEICIGAAFEEDDGQIWCTMCKFRSQKIAESPPEPMKDTSETGLIKHCEEQHPVGWATLRNGNKQKKKENAGTPA